MRDLREAIIDGTGLGDAGMSKAKNGKEIVEAFRKDLARVYGVQFDEAGRVVDYPDDIPTPRFGRVLNDLDRFIANLPVPKRPHKKQAQKTRRTNLTA